MKIVYLLLAFLFLGLGIVGIFLPLVPTTPFLLVTTFLFAKSSTRFHQWFINTKLYQRHLADFLQTRQMKKASMWTLLIVTTIMMMISGLILNLLVTWVIIIVIDTLKYTYFLLKIKAI
jgi:uncharacterized membrane protein YbaN (DUF454 family)